MNRYMKMALLLCIPLLALLAMPGSIFAQSTPQQVTLTLNEFTITPSSFTVTQGQPVHFTINNVGKFPHNVTFMQGSEMVTLEAQPLNGGQSGTADFTFDQAGTWEMHCPVDSHASKGMVGQVIVNAANTPGIPVTGEATGLIPYAAAGVLGAVLISGGLILRRRRAGRAS